MRSSTPWLHWDMAKSWPEALCTALMRHCEIAAHFGHPRKQHIWRSTAHERYTGGQFWIISSDPRGVTSPEKRAR